MSEEAQPLLSNEPQESDIAMDYEAPAEPEPSPRDKALESFKRKLIDHREHDNKLKNRTHFKTGAERRLIL